MAPRPPGPETAAGAPSANDVRSMKAHARQNDAAYADAYRRGQQDARAGRPHGHSAPLEAEHDEAYAAGFDEAQPAPSNPSPGGGTGGQGAPETPPARTAPGRSLLTGKPQNAVDSGAGLILGMVAYALAINYLRGGLPAVRGWFAAKFLNHPYTGSLTGAAPAPAPPVTPSPNVAGPPVGTAPVFGSPG